MRRHEAVLVLAKILKSCEPFAVDYISLEHPNKSSFRNSTGYELHFKWSIDERTFNVIKEIVIAQNLGFKEYDEHLVIYTPKKTKNTIGIIA